MNILSTNSFPSTLTLASTTEGTGITSPLISSCDDIQYNNDTVNPLYNQQYDSLHLILIKHIIHVRLKAAIQISSFIRYVRKYKTKMVTEEILTQRHKAIIKLQSTMKAFRQYNHMKNYLNKIHQCYQIQTCLEHSNRLVMVVYLSKSKEKEFVFEYDEYTKKYAIYIPRITISESCYKVNFIADDRIIIDPAFACDNDKERGKYVNIINFDKIRKEEEDKRKVDRMNIRYMMSYIRNSHERVYSNDSITKTEDEEKNQDEGNDSLRKSYKERSSLCIKSALHSSLKSPHKFSTSKGLGSLPMPIPRPKSILKIIRRQSGKDLPGMKKVRFGQTEFSI